MRRPKPITIEEFDAKITHLSTVLKRKGYTGIYLTSEGSMRWLTGHRHQVTDISPLESTTIHCLITCTSEKTLLHFYSEMWEQNRLRSLLEDEIFSSQLVEVKYSLIDTLSLNKNILSPSDKEYREIEREIVSILPQQLLGNQMEKLLYLASNSRKALVEISHLVRPGMNGWDLRTLVYTIFHEKHLELNQVVLGLSHMESFQHPIVEDESVVEKGSFIKIVVGARYMDMLHSASQMVKIEDDISPLEMKVYEALTDFSLRYASTFTSGAIEKDIYEGIASIAKDVEKDYQLKGFSQSAYLHHLGGPLSPLGNRDFLITKGATRKILPYSQFAINPVDPIFNHKCELQGIVLPEHAPLILDEFALVEKEFLTMNYHGGQIRVPTIITTHKEETYEQE